MKHILILIIISFLLAGCRKISDPVSVNRYDPESEYFTGNPAKGLNVQTPSRNSVKLIWRDSSSFETGYKIERTNITSGGTEIFTTEKDVSSYTDENLDVKDVYRYRIGVLTGSKIFKYTDSVTISYSPYPEIVKTPFKGEIQLQLSKDSKRCMALSPVSEYEPQVINIYEINGNNFSLIRTKALYPRSAYKYQLSGNGRYVAFAGMYRYGYYDIDNNKTVDYSHINQEDYHLGVSPDSKFILVGRESDRLILLNVETNTQQTFYINFGYWYDKLPILMSPDNHYVVCSTPDEIKIYDITTNTLHSSFRFPFAHNLVMDINDNSDVFFFHSYYFNYAQPVKFLNLKTKEVFLSKSVPVIRSMKYVSNSQFILGFKENKLFLWKMEDNMPSAEIPVYLPDNMSFEPWNWQVLLEKSGAIFALSNNYEGSNTLFIRFMENWHVLK